MAVVHHKEAIHSGHFMVSEFEADAEPEVIEESEMEEEKISLTTGNAEEVETTEKAVAMVEETEVAVTPKATLEPVVEAAAMAVSELAVAAAAATAAAAAAAGPKRNYHKREAAAAAAKSIFDISLNRLFQRMSIAYRQKLTSPKWNHFRGLKLRWKDKIRLNNVIWRCWHMQFIKGRNRLLCAFANPLEIDNHNMTEGGTLLEGKYWKRKLRTITNEYHRWRMFYKARNHHSPSSSGRSVLFPSSGLTSEKAEHVQNEIVSGDNSNNNRNNGDGAGPDDAAAAITSGYDNGGNFGGVSGSGDSIDADVVEASGTIVKDDDTDIDYLLQDSDFLVDALFSSMGEANHSFAVPFPNPRDVYKSTTNADFIQPGLIQLQPNLDDLNIVDLDWLTSSKKMGEQQPSSFPNISATTTSVPATAFSLPTTTTETTYDYNKGGYLFDYNSPAYQPTQEKMRSPKHRFLRRDQLSTTTTTTTTTTAIHSRSVQLPYPKDEPRRFLKPQQQHQQQEVQEILTESASELLQLLKRNKTRSSKKIDPQIPPPPPNAAPQPLAGSSKPSFRGRTDTPQYQEHRRSVHVSAEQKRRGSIKNGFEIMRTLIPSLNQNANVKISKAALLHKGGDYLQQLKAERNNLSAEIQEIQSKIKTLNEEIQAFQNMLPTVRSSSPGSQDEMKDRFEGHVLRCTQQNWKYWIFSLLMRPMLESFDSSVGSGSFDDMFRTSLSWLDQHCSMKHLRQMTINSLTHLSTTTDILAFPEHLPQTSLQAVLDQTVEREARKKAKKDEQK